MIGRRPFLAVPLVSLPSAGAQRERYSFDQDSGRIGFTFRDLVFTATGRLGRFRATVMLDPGHPMSMAVDCVLDMRTIEVSIPGATERLRSEAFFDVGHFPEARFHGEADGQGDATSFPILGELTMRNVTRPFRMRSRLVERRPGMVRFQADGEISRGEFGLLADRALVSDAVELNVDAWVVL